MILTIHAIVGASIGRLVLNPYEAFTLGFMSHFLIDAIPHCGYRLASITQDVNNPLNKDMVLDKRFLKDLIFITIDFFVGISLAIFIFQDFSLPILAGILGGVLPDALQFVYFKIRRQPLITLQKIHIWFHLNHKSDIPALPYGMPSQIFLTISAIFISKFIR